MLIKESQLLKPAKLDPMSMLDEATFLSEEESKVQPVTIPVREMSRLGEGVTMVRFADVERLAEDSQVSYMDAVAAIAEASEVDASKLTIAVDEADLIVDPSLLDEMTNIVVAPLSESSVAYRYVAECIDAWADMDAENADELLEAALVEDTELKAFAEAEEAAAPEEKGKLAKAADAVKGAAGEAAETAKAAAGQAVEKGKELGGKAVEYAKENPKQVVGGALAAAGIAAAIYKASNNKPKSWIGQKIAALRNVYAKWMKKAQNADASVAGRIKAAAGKIMAIIDKLMAKLQNAAG